MKMIKNSAIAVIAATIMIGCGDGGGSTTSNPELTGVFIDAAVKGLNVTCNGLESTTTSGGEFKYKKDDTCTFKVADITLGSTIGASLVTPEAITSNPTQLSNILRFLQTLDTDNDPTNGIVLPTGYTGTITDFESNFDADFVTFLSNNADASVIVSEADALAHYGDLNQKISGTRISFAGKDIQMDFNTDGSVKRFGTGEEFDPAASFECVGTWSVSGTTLTYIQTACTPSEAGGSASLDFTFNTLVPSVGTIMTYTHAHGTGSETISAVVAVP